jgi:hypothetical protein
MHLIAWHGVDSELMSHTSTGIVIQQDYAIEFTQMFVLDPCTELLKCVAETVVIDFITRFKPEAWVPHCQRTVNRFLLVCACDLNFFWQDEI